MKSVLAVLGLALAVGCMVLGSFAGLSTARPGSAPSPFAFSAASTGSSGHPALHSALASPAVHSKGLVGHNTLVPASSGPGPTSSAPAWSDGCKSCFFRDVNVSFSIPGEPGIPNFPTVPLVGNISQYALGFYMNISTSVPITHAVVYVWATTWPVPNIGPQPVTGFDPATWNTSDGYPMVVGTNPDTASFYFDCYKYFWPGTNISFMLEVQSTASNPTTIYSNATREVQESYPSGYVTFPTWEINVLGPFASTNFSNDIHVRTTPQVLTQPAFDPNPTQQVQVIITSYNISGGAATPIPLAVLQYTISYVSQGQRESVTYSSNFGPDNSTTMDLNTPIQAAAGGTTVSFNITAWLPWYGGTGRVDTVLSNQYNFTFSSKGGWLQPNEPLEANAQLNATPNVISTGQTALPTGTRVNVTVHEPVENITLTRSEIDFEFNDHGAKATGALRMTMENHNTTYAVIPGLPPGAVLTFSVVTKDLYNDPISSSNYTYTETGPTLPAPLFGKGFFFVEVYDVAKTALVTGATFAVANASWSQNTSTSGLGFGALLSYSSNQFVQLAYGTYFLTVSAFGSTITRPITVNASMPSTVILFVSSSPVHLQTSSPAPAGFAIAAVVGLVGACIAYFPLMAWFKERRAKAEAEQRRVTL